MDEVACREFRANIVEAGWRDPDPLEDAAQALRDLDERRALGKSVLVARP